MEKDIADIIIHLETKQTVQSHLSGTGYEGVEDVLLSTIQFSYVVSNRPIFQTYHVLKQMYFFLIMVMTR